MEEASSEGWVGESSIKQGMEAGRGAAQTLLHDTTCCIYF